MKIKEILNDTSLVSLYEKQISIEKLILNYDLELFKNNFSESTNVKSVILHDIYKKLYKSKKKY